MKNKVISYHLLEAETRTYTDDRHLMIGYGSRPAAPSFRIQDLSDALFGPKDICPAMIGEILPEPIAFSLFSP